jgi:4-amino-4-deoxy-L-arabinose transferase-like glycosyltransferase
MSLLIRFDRIMRDRWSRSWILIWVVTAVTAALHLMVAGRYDLMRNELYFLACGLHPAFGYADQPPLVPLIAAATQVFGQNVWLMRLPAVIAVTALVPLTAAFAGLLGGNGKARIIAAFAIALAFGIAGISTTLTTASFEPLTWTASAYLVARAVRHDDRRALIWAGLVIGLSMEAKYGIVIWLIPMAVGLALTSARRILAWRECWIGLAVAVILSVPSLIWQAANGWPFVEIIANHTAGNITGDPAHFELGQVLAANPLLAPLWMTGVVAPFVTERLRSVRFLAITFVGATALTLATHGKDYYLFGAYPAMFAIGAVVAARLWTWVICLWLVASAANFALIAPILLPLLPPQQLFALLESKHLRPAPDEKAAVGAPLTQVFSEEMGWRELEKRVATAYRALPPADRARAAIFATNYGEAAAIDVYGRRDGLPPAISGDNQYHLWGARGYDGSVMLHINGNPDAWRDRCASVTVVGHFGMPLAMPFEQGRPIFLCRSLHGGLAAAWPQLKRYGQ